MTFPYKMTTASLPDISEYRGAVRSSAFHPSESTDSRATVSAPVLTPRSL